MTPFAVEILSASKCDASRAERRRGGRLHMPLGRTSAAEVDKVRRSGETGHTTFPSAEAVLQQIGRILEAKPFRQSDKLSRFLRFVAEHVLSNKAELLKEYLIGVEVYDRKPSYDPSQDSIVRTEARRLRSKLKQYYETEGNQDPIYVYLRPGSYVPVFQNCEGMSHEVRLVSPQTSVVPKTSAMVMAILPFRDVSTNSLSSAYARGIPDELAYRLTLASSYVVLSPTWIASLVTQQDNLAALMSKAGAHLAFEGSVRADGTRIKITVRILDANSSQLWVKRVGIEGPTQYAFGIEEQIVSELCAGLEAVRAGSAALQQGSIPAQTK